MNGQLRLISRVNDNKNTPSQHESILRGREYTSMMSSKVINNEHVNKNDGVERYNSSLLPRAAGASRGRHKAGDVPVS